MTAESIVKMLGGRNGMARCPCHDDKTPSLSITERNGKLLGRCHAGCKQDDVVGALKARDLWPEPEQYECRGILATYDYTDEHGALLYQVVRQPHKKFFQRRPDGAGGWLNNNPKSLRHVLYHLPEVLANPIIFVVEGEKDCATLRSHGFVASTNAGGAKAPWLLEFTEALRHSNEVILIPDRDEPGYARVQRIAQALRGAVAKLTYLELPDGKDVTEWFERGHSELELIHRLHGEEEDFNEA